MAEPGPTPEMAAKRAWEARDLYILPDLFYIAITVTVFTLVGAFVHLTRGHLSLDYTSLINAALVCCVVAVILFLVVTYLGFAYDRSKKHFETSARTGRQTTHNYARENARERSTEALGQCECNCESKVHRPMWLEIFPQNLRSLMLSAPGQLALSFVILLGILHNRAPTWLQEMGTYEVISSYHTRDTMRLPGMVILAQRDDPFAARIVDDNGPPFCYWRRVNNTAPCEPGDYSNPSINKSCNCSRNITSSSTSLTIRGREYDAYVLAAPFNVSEAHIPVLYWTRPNPGSDVSAATTDGPRPLVPRERCTQSSLFVAFFDAQAVSDYATDNALLGDTIGRAFDSIQRISAGQVIDIQLRRRDFQSRDRNKPPITVFDPIWSPSVSTGSCDTAFYVSYATLMVQEASENPILEPHELIAELGGILAQSPCGSMRLNSTLRCLANFSVDITPLEGVRILYSATLIAYATPLFE
ncbi:hypothetical protein IE81DRAFT_331332 [Ceraceosorus guamensis]|uniref:Uncharacterized protein n=1 Tax=Ceraceosorus guamensis TaxID=1522189 RepID=A0A316VZB8_9BASI|nr:hypothetical protein IE81DRAFT_331332 [Ceraceosorus guamensis]PWN40845.1 hypothetical protein IE81DRAFT_331332 [Ceraceosorus guamensis]